MTTLELAERYQNDPTELLWKVARTLFERFCPEHDHQQCTLRSFTVRLGEVMIRCGCGGGTIIPERLVQKLLSDA